MNLSLCRSQIGGMPQGGYFSVASNKAFSKVIFAAHAVPNTKNNYLRFTKHLPPHTMKAQGFTYTNDGRPV